MLNDIDNKVIAAEKKMYNKIKITGLILIIFFSITCRTHMFYNRGEKFFEAKDWDNSVKYLVKALDKDPDNIDYRLLLGKALISSSLYHYKRGENYFKKKMYKLAQVEFDKSLENNPENMKARYKKKEVLLKIRELRKEDRKENKLSHLKTEINADNLKSLDSRIAEKPFKVNFSNKDLKFLFKMLEKSSNVRFLYHPNFKSKKITINEEEISILELLDKIMLQTNLFYKIIDSNTIFIIPDKPANRKKYEELVMRTFFISDGDPGEISKIIKAITNIRNIIPNKTLNTLTIKSTLEKVKLAEQIIEVNDKPKGEVLIDIEIIEVNKTRVNEYGIDLSSYNIGHKFAPNTLGDDGAPLVSFNDLRYSDASDHILNLPSINYKLLKTDRNSKIKAKPHIRAIDGEKIELKVGDKVPIPTTTFVPQYGGSTPNNQPITSFTLQEIGINIELTPKIHHDGWITIQMKFELTFISSPGDTERNTPPTIGNRTVKSIIRLKDNETAIMAGLLRDTERKSVKSIPFISKIPILKSIFSGNSNEVEQTDIILTITPRIIRYPEITKSDLKYTWVGTASKPGLKKSSPPKFYTEIKKKIEKKDEKKKIKQKKLRINKTKIKAKAEIKEKKKIPVEFVFDLKKSQKNILSNVKINKGKGLKSIKLELSFDPEIMSISGLKKSPFLMNHKIKNLLFKRFNNKEGTVNLNLTFDSPININGNEIINLKFKAKNKKPGTIKLEKIILLDKDSKIIKTSYKINKLKD